MAASESQKLSWPNILSLNDHWKINKIQGLKRASWSALAFKNKFEAEEYQKNEWQKELSQSVLKSQAKA